jgi:hypothetical protein
LLVAANQVGQPARINPIISGWIFQFFIVSLEYYG